MSHLTKPNPLQRLQALALDGRFAKSNTNYKKGELRQKTWRVQGGLLERGTDAELAKWETRAIEYWALQGYKYGVIFDLESTQNYLVDDVFITTARVAHVVPGNRIPEVVWRSQNPPAKIMAQLGIDVS